MKKIITILFLVSLLNICPGIINAETARKEKPSIRDKIMLDQYGKPDIPQKTNGYFIWQDGAGWHIRWKTLAGKHAISGVIRCNGEFIKTRQRHIEDTEAIVSMTKNYIEYKAWNRGKLDGFDFNVSLSTTWITFDIMMDNKYYPTYVNIGANNMHPEIVPFTIKL